MAAVEPLRGVYTISQFYADIPVAWDGAEQLLYTSSTNNCRYYGVTANDAAEMQFALDWGFTTTSTSNNPYPSPNTLAFVRPGMVPTFQYDSSTAKYSVVILGVEGTTVTKLSSTPYPSQVFSAGGFLRVMMAHNGNPEIIFYGNASSMFTCWKATVDEAGQLSPITQVGSPFTISGNPYLDGPLIPFGPRFSMYPNSWLAFDRQNPQAPFSLKTLLPATPGMDAQYDRYYAEHVYNPNRLIVVRKSNGWQVPPAAVVLDVEFAEDTRMLTVVGSWNVPSGRTTPYITILPGGQVVAALSLTSDGFGASAAFYDIFGKKPQDLGQISTASTQYISPTNAGFTTSSSPAYQNQHNILAWPPPPPEYVDDGVRRIFWGQT